jgi:hypothetical protein
MTDNWLCPNPRVASLVSQQFPRVQINNNLCKCISKLWVMAKTNIYKMTYWFGLTIFHNHSSGMVVKSWCRPNYCTNLIPNFLKSWRRHLELINELCLCIPWRNGQQCVPALARLIRREYKKGSPQHHNREFCDPGRVWKGDKVIGNIPFASFLPPPKQLNSHLRRLCALWGFDVCIDGAE